MHSLALPSSLLKLPNYFNYSDYFIAHGWLHLSVIIYKKSLFDKLKNTFYQICSNMFDKCRCFMAYSDEKTNGYESWSIIDKTIQLRTCVPGYFYTQEELSAIYQKQ